MRNIHAASAGLAVGLSLFVFGLLGSSAALAQVVERSGNVYNIRVCPGPAGPGTARCHARVVTNRSGQIATNTTPAGYGPSDLEKAYGVYPGATSITGPWIALIEAYGYPNAERDLGKYRSTYGLPACTSSNLCFKKVSQTGGSTSNLKSNTNWDLEQALDIEMVSAICPQCEILLVEANSDSYSDLDTAVSYANSQKPQAMSNSYGSSEAGTSIYEWAYCQAATATNSHKGVAVTVSSGDSGYAAGPQFPASSSCVIAVGGTSLTRSGTQCTSANRWCFTEAVWSGAGSGCSTVYTKPSWQLDTIIGTLSPGCNMRMVADVSAVGNPNTGVAVYGPIFGPFSAWVVVGGTSVGAPLIAGLYGLNGGLVDRGSNPYSAGKAPLPPATPQPYAINPNLNVITSGNNGSCGTPSSYYCSANPAWDYNGPTGLGTPHGSGAFGQKPAS